METGPQYQDAIELQNNLKGEVESLLKEVIKKYDDDHDLHDILTAFLYALGHRVNHVEGEGLTQEAKEAIGSCMMDLYGAAGLTIVGSNPAESAAYFDAKTQETKRAERPLKKKTLHGQVLKLKMRSHTFGEALNPIIEDPAMEASQENALNDLLGLIEKLEASDIASFKLLFFALSCALCLHPHEKMLAEKYKREDIKGILSFFVEDLAQVDGFILDSETHAMISGPEERFCLKAIKRAQNHREFREAEMARQIALAQELSLRDKVRPQEPEIEIPVPPETPKSPIDALLGHFSTLLRSFRS